MSEPSQQTQVRELPPEEISRLLDLAEARREAAAPAPILRLEVRQGPDGPRVHIEAHPDLPPVEIPGILRAAADELDERQPKDPPS